ncbi:MAG TPA: hypothetical protein VMV92_05810 [Streptosporangiaceae bacterium]|nr:hypothetical protein [Streptosporangiaceae bacterium]
MHQHRPRVPGGEHALADPGTRRRHHAAIAVIRLAVIGALVTGPAVTRLTRTGAPVTGPAVRLAAVRLAWPVASPGSNSPAVSSAGPPLRPRVSVTTERGTPNRLPISACETRCPAQALAWRT